MKNFLLSSVVILSFTGASSAAIVLSPTRAGLGANDSISWGQLIQNQLFLEVAQPFDVTSNLGTTVAVSAMGAPTQFSVFAFNQDFYGGNFSPGDHLLYSITGTPLTLNFENPVSRVGFNIMADFFGPFVGNLEAFDEDNVSLGTFSVNGTGTNTNDGSAVFLGISNGVANIKSIAFSTEVPNQENPAFVINEVAFSSIPEPSSTFSLGGLIAVTFLMTRQRKRA